MYTTLKFNDYVYADVLKDEVIAWVYGIDGQQEHMESFKYKDDDSLVRILNKIRKFINSNRHRDVFDFLYTEFKKDGDDVKYDDDGSVIVRMGRGWSDEEFNDIINRLSEFADVGGITDEYYDDFGSYSTFRPVYHLGLQVAKIYKS